MSDMPIYAKPARQPFKQAGSKAARQQLYYNAITCNNHIIT